VSLEDLPPEYREQAGRILEDLRHEFELLMMANAIAGMVLGALDVPDDPRGRMCLRNSVPIVLARLREVHGEYADIEGGNVMFTEDEEGGWVPHIAWQARFKRPLKTIVSTVRIR
jgi:hypothetical protein